MRKKSFVLTLLLLTNLFAFGCQKEQKTVLVLDWTPNTNHTGIYVALDKGYYQDAGIDLDIMQPPENGAELMVSVGQADFGISTQETFIGAISADSPMPLTTIASIIQHNDSGIASLTAKNIQSPIDLENKKIPTWGSPVFEPMIQYIMEKGQADYDKVDIVYSDATDNISLLQTTMDAAWIYYSWDGIAMQEAGIDFNYFSVRDIDSQLDFYTPILITNDDLIAENPKLVDDFVSATRKGYEYAIENPAESANILLKYAPELNTDLVRSSQEYLAPLYQDDAPYWGYIDINRWGNFNRWMYEHQIIKTDIGEKGVYQP